MTAWPLRDTRGPLTGPSRSVDVRRSARLNITEIPVRARASLGYDYILKLSPRRRSISLEVEAGRIIVRAPRGVDRDQLQQWLLQRRGWVVEKQRQLRLRSQQAVAPQYADGGVFKWLGDELRLRLRPGQRSEVRLSGSELQVSCGPRAGGEAWLRRTVQNWYRQQALPLLADKTRNCAAELGVTVGDIRLRLTRSKWGHCTRSGIIQYNWLIALAPESVVDYLVIHEVCHRRHLNHSRAYWQLVESLCPDYLRRRQWLKDWGHTLVL